MAEYGEGVRPDIKRDEPLAQLAIEAARRTRAQGFGLLHGIFPPNLEIHNRGNWQEIQGFIQGEEVIDNYDRVRQLSGLMNWLGLPRDVSCVDEDQLVPADYSDVADQKTHAHRQIWTASRHHPKTSVRKQGRFPLPAKKITEYQAFNGKHGEEGWTEYTYMMHLPLDPEYNYSRPGCWVAMNVVVPPDVSAMMDKAVASSPYFPDAYFKALYPGLVGEDTKTHINRQRATELLIRDFRKNPDRKQGTIIQYPQPIPF